MANNFNFQYLDNIEGSGYGGIRYKDAKGNTLTLPSAYFESSLMRTYIAPFWKKQAYEAHSLVWQYGQLYYNPNALASENWNVSHWTQTTLADYIKLMTT